MFFSTYENEVVEDLKSEAYASGYDLGLMNGIALSMSHLREKLQLIESMETDSYKLEIARDTITECIGYIEQLI